MKFYILNFVLSILPATRCFMIKRFLAQWAGIQIAAKVCLNGGTHFYGRGKLTLGENTWIGLHNIFYLTQLAHIQIGANCDIGPEVSFIPGSHKIGGLLKRADQGIAADIIIENGCWIGARVTILGGVTIAQGSVIGAGSLVNKNIPENVIAVGIPARVIKKLSVI
jgi:maltose O-acetyltransferase